jgi:hypothetical protein
MPIGAVYPFIRPAVFLFPHIIPEASRRAIRHAAMARRDAARRRSFLAYRFYFLFIVFSCMGLSVRGRVFVRF